MCEGYIKIIQTDRHFGFIKSINEREEYFFHKDDFLGDWFDLLERYAYGEYSQVKVQFLKATTPKGLRARNVSLVEENDTQT